MTPSLHDAKSALRAQVRTELAKLSAAQRTAASGEACALLEKQTLWREAKTILFFAPLPDEPDTWPLLTDALKAGKTALLPKFEPEHNHYVAYHITNVTHDLQAGRFGVREPRDTCVKFPLNRLDLILVPGIAFDLNGRRLGRGKGFYDRLLAALRGPACGVAFDQQIVNEIPVEPHDIRLSCILTPTRWHPETGSARL
jgi:5-formyltetrahydrofolate cyclo-ligase